MANSLHELCRCGHKLAAHTTEGICGVLSRPGDQLSAPYAPCGCTAFSVMTDEAMRELVEAKHAEIYPHGCPNMCEACAKRLAPDAWGSRGVEASC